ncbi:hypothetical protein OKW21_001047 [Catalinimonas alkaloidigena]|uniref:hypothetical protein n=1 Tax=Catalinimonas alkaloidigena TaxID=1075417 RepID=UPI002406E79A|nr:hypothetical protein [Catalinimonas alkaloidigena]MDF9795784.1 hypothetical protein [Catalinimonas alkaloidigena]
MSIRKLMFVLYAVMLLSAVNISAQHILAEFDSISISKLKSLKPRYQVNHTIVSEISLINRAPEAVSYVPRKFWANLREGTFTLLTGFSTSSTEDALWVSENEIKFADPAYTWQVPLFFHGAYMKNRERVENDDGSSSVETQKGVYVDWSRGAYGLILSQGDSLGGFTLITNLEDDTASMSWLARIGEEQSQVRDKLKKYEAGQMHYNFQLIAVLRGNLYTILSSGSHFASLIMLEAEPIAIFQSNPNYIILNKKDRITPYLLFSKTVKEEERMDLIRLAFLSAILVRSMSVDFYSM